MIIVGHRGAAGLAPENTLKGFALAMELGVDAVECDVRLTRDGQIVLMHDATVDRTTSGAGAVAEMDLAEIRALDAGDGETVPTLGELLAAVKGRCHLLCEVKATKAAVPAARAVLAEGMAPEVTFVSFDVDALAAVRQCDGGLATGILIGEPGIDGLDAALASPSEHVGIYHGVLSPEIVRRARRAGKQVGAWTMNTPETMRAMIELGVDVLTSDRPDILLDVAGMK
ncbi:MAG TPA: glycerophosphodiester phosphodiesterase family protein [Phycisphaerae bacterium]|nr:glycerophosphodiester phosphodiesterase family protein [Phycisphaerae bacterium]